MWGALAVCVAAAVFLPALTGEFVYDDNRQIVANPLIQSGDRVGEALISDVWAFKATDEAPGSNYWRPAFVSWLILNHRLFGLEPWGWHLTNLLLHALVVGLAFGLLRQLRVDAPVAAAVGLLFAVHPVHVESVAWVSGSPDLLLAAGTLGAVWGVLSALERPAWWKWAIALASGAIAITSKEVGVVLPVIVFAAAALPRVRPEDSRSGTRWRRAALAATPFAAIAAAYFAGRLVVIEGFSQEAPWDHGLLETVLTAPAVLAFYLRQMFLPIELGPVYPVRPVSSGRLSVGNFVLPLLITLAVAALGVWMARWGRVQMLGLVIFVLSLLPALNLAAFPPEHLVHDRYLYLPLLGALMMVVPTAADLLRRGRAPARAEDTVLIAACVLAVPLAALTLGYTRVWKTESALWERAVQTDPGSASSWMQHAVMLRRAGRSDAAFRALDRSIEIAPMPPALIERSDLLLEAGRAAEAEPDLRRVLDTQPGNPLPYERLAVIEQARGRLGEAEALLRAGREAAPGAACSFAANLGVVLFLQGRREDARAELERAAALAERDLSPVCRTGVFHLGSLRAELGDAHGAREAWARYLALTEGFTDATSTRLRAEASRLLATPTSAPGP